MTQTADPLVLERPIKRRWFIAAGEPHDPETLEHLCAEALREAAERLKRDETAADMFDRVIRSRGDRAMSELDRYVSSVVSDHLVNQKQRQPVRKAAITFFAVPDEAKRELVGVIRVEAWKHAYRTTFVVQLPS